MHTHTHTAKKNTCLIQFSFDLTLNIHTRNGGNDSEWWKWLVHPQYKSHGFFRKKNKHLIASSLFLFSSIRLKSGIVIIYLPLAETISMAQVHHETFKMASLFWLLLWISLWFNLMNFPPHNYKNPALARENNSLGMQHTHTKLAHSKKKRQKQT